MINPLDFFTKCQIADINTTELQTKIHRAARDFVMRLGAYVMMGAANFCAMLLGRKGLKNHLNGTFGVLLYSFWTTLAEGVYRADKNRLPLQPQNPYSNLVRSFAQHEAYPKLSKKGSGVI